MDPEEALATAICGRASADCVTLEPEKISTTQCPKQAISLVLSFWINPSSGHGICSALTKLSFRCTGKM